MSDLLAAARAALPGVGWLQVVGGRSLLAQGLADITLDLPVISIDDEHNGYPIKLHVAKTTWECVDAADMERTLRRTMTARRDALDAALGEVPRAQLSEALRLCDEQVYEALPCPDCGSGWVPVSERLPEEGAAVLAWDGHMVHMVTLESDGHHWIDDGSASDTNVTHWRELPMPPKGEGK